MFVSLLVLALVLAPVPVFTPSWFRLCVRGLGLVGFTPPMSGSRELASDAYSADISTWIAFILCNLVASVRVCEGSSPDGSELSIYAYKIFRFSGFLSIPAIWELF